MSTFYVISLRQRAWGSAAQAQFLTNLHLQASGHASVKCNVHIGVAIFLDLNVPVFKRLKTWAFQWLKTHWLQPVFGGFLSPTGLIRNRPGSGAECPACAPADERPGCAGSGLRPGSGLRGPGPDHESPDPAPATSPSQQFLPSPMRALSLPNWQPFLCSPWNGKNWAPDFKNWCNRDIFWCWPSHMENELKAPNKSYFGPRMLSCLGKKLIKSLDNHETSCRRFLSWNKIRPFEGHNNRFLCHQIKCFCFLFWGKAVANCILNRF